MRSEKNLKSPKRPSNFFYQKVKLLNPLVLTSTCFVLAACNLLTPSSNSAHGASQPVAVQTQQPELEVAAKRQSPRSPSKVTTLPVSYDQLPGWNSDAVAKALPAFRKSCSVFSGKPDSHYIGKTKLGGKASDWKRVCAELKTFKSTDDVAARAFIRKNFEPHVISGRGVFTGYYEPLLVGSLTRQPGFNYPLYVKPEKASTWMKKKGTGPTRRLLETSWSNNLKPLVWLRDPVEVFMLHVQGSGLVNLTNGRRLRVSYSGDNGHKYASVFPAMKKGGFPKGMSKSLQGMTKWLQDNPDKATEIMYTNPRFIFFRAHASEGPIGAEGVTLTPGRSMAVDPRHIPLGVPLWLDTKAFYRGKMMPVQRLMVAQDVGAAIKGVVRGDVYWGTGPAALEVAGNMKEPGRYFILLPRENGSKSFASRD